jgi:hypothetical protein
MICCLVESETLQGLEPLPVCDGLTAALTAAPSTEFSFSSAADLTAVCPTGDLTSFASSIADFPSYAGSTTVNSSSASFSTPNNVNHREMAVDVLDLAWMDYVDCQNDTICSQPSIAHPSHRPHPLSSGLANETVENDGNVVVKESNHSVALRRLQLLSRHLSVLHGDRCRYA